MANNEDKSKNFCCNCEHYTVSALYEPYVSDYEDDCKKNRPEHGEWGFDESHDCPEYKTSKYPIKPDWLVKT